MYPVKQSTVLTVPIFAHDANGDAVTGMVDGGFTKRISKNGAAFGAMTVTITEMENGWYSVPLSTSHTDTLGLLSMTFTNASCKQVNLQLRVTAKLIDDLNDIAATDIVSGGAINTTTGAVDNVTTVATTTTNTDMRGTDSAALASVCTEARLAELDAANLPADLDAVLLDTGDMQPKLGTPAADISADIAAVKSETASILTDTASIGVTKNAAFSNFEFPMVLTSDHYTAATGKTVTGQRSIDGGAFAAVSGTIAEVGSGIYQFDALAADTNGDVITWKFSAVDCDDTTVTIKTRA